MPEFLLTTKSLLDPILHLYENPDFAYSLATAMGIFLIVTLLVAIISHVFVWTELSAKHQKLSQLVGADKTDLDQVRQTTADKWNEICSVMSKQYFRPKIGSSSEDSHLTHAWREFRETLVDESQSPIRNTVRPHTIFGNAVHGPNWLNFLANLSVGVGLLLTFVGLVAALTFAANGMQGGDSSSMQAELEKLLGAASSKFITSIMGVLMSIIYKMFAAGFTKNIHKHLDGISLELERGLLFASPQSIAMDSERHLREQNDTLKELATDLSVKLGDQISDKLGVVFSPIAQSIGALQESFEKGYKEQAEALRAGAGDAISGSIRAETTALAQKLSAIAEGLGQLQGALNSSGTNVSNEIDRATDRLASVSKSMEAHFNSLGEQAAEIGRAFSEQAGRELDGATNRMQTIFGEIESSNQRQSQSLAQAVMTIQTATSEAAGKIANEASGAVSNAAEQASDLIRQSTSGMAESMERAGAQAALTVDALQRVQNALADQTQSLHEAASSTRETAAVTNKSTEHLRAASSSAQSILESVTSLTEKLNHQNAEASAFASELKLGAEAVRIAWSNHNDRFGEVDKNLGEAITRLHDVLSHSEREMIKRVDKVDSEFAKGINSLRELVEDLTDLQMPAQSDRIASN